MGSSFPVARASKARTIRSLTVRRTYPRVALAGDRTIAHPPSTSTSPRDEGQVPAERGAEVVADMVDPEELVVDEALDGMLNAPQPASSALDNLAEDDAVQETAESEA